MFKSSGSRSASNGWTFSLVTVALLGACRADAPSAPSLGLQDSPSLASSKPIHTRDVEFSFSGVVPCSDVGIAIDATFEFQATDDITDFFGQPRVLRIHEDFVLTLRNVATGETVINQGVSNLTFEVRPDGITMTETGSGKYRDAEGRIIFRIAGRRVFDQATGEVFFEAGQHPEFEPDFLTFVCTELS